MRRVMVAAAAVSGMLGACVIPTVALAASAEKVAVCHSDDDAGQWQLLRVSSKGNAVQAHRGHGDALPGEPVPAMDGYVFDDACVAVAVDVTDGDDGTEPTGGPEPASASANGIWAVAYVDTVDDGQPFDAQEEIFLFGGGVHDRLPHWAGSVAGLSSEREDFSRLKTRPSAGST